MDSDAMDVCVGPNNKDPDGTRRRCGQKHFTRLHMQLHSTARLAVIENQDTLDYQFYLKMKSQDGFPSNPAPSVTRGRSGFCDNLVTVATVIGILGCGAYLLLPECVLLTNCAPHRCHRQLRCRLDFVFGHGAIRCGRAPARRYDRCHLVRSSSPAARQCSFFEWDNSLALPAVDPLPPSSGLHPVAVSTVSSTTRGQRRVSFFDELVQFLVPPFLQLLWSRFWRL